MARINSTQIITIIILVFCITGCNSQSQNITLKNSPMSWHATTIPSETGSISFDYRLKQYLILDSLTGFMIGNNLGAEVHNSVDQNRAINKSNYRTVLFKTEDGGLSFKKSTVGKGTLEKIVSDTQRNLYVIKETYKSDSVNTRKYSILKSIDLGETWKKISDFKTNRIRNIQFYNDKKGIACIDNKLTGAQLLKTIDGGKTWQELSIPTKGVSIYDMIFINEDQLYTYHEIDNLKQTASVDFTTGKTKIHPCNLPKDYDFDVFFKDNITGDLYSEVNKYSPKGSHELMLYNHTSKQLNTYDFISSGKELIIGVTLSQNYIGVLRQDNGKTHYYYSYDNGKNWTKEELSDSLTTGRPVAIHGRGMVWVKNAVRNLYDLQVRIPDTIK